MNKQINSPIIISHVNLFDKDCLKIDFQFSWEIIKVLNKSPILKYSLENKCWYAYNEKGNLKELKDFLAVFPQVKYLKKGEKFEPSSQYNSVFISYSFMDKEFAHKLDTILTDNYINTFLWEKDAPYGKSLKKIMIENINRYDKLLFIASENSIKSKACQFELSNGRLKQDKLWKNILFPIHIDNYLFQIDKYDIRPRAKRDEYWLNITELKDLNSADFSEFAKDNMENDETKFSQKVLLLIEDLKKNGG